MPHPEGRVARAGEGAVAGALKAWAVCVVGAGPHALRAAGAGFGVLVPALGALTLVGRLQRVGDNEKGVGLLRRHDVVGSVPDVNVPRGTVGDGDVHVIAGDGRALDLM